MTIVKRVFKGRDLAMLTAGSTIVSNAILHKEVLQAKRSNWEGTYFDDLGTRIKTFTEDHYGKDAAQKLRDATTLINGMQDTALEALSTFKLQLVDDFKKDKAFSESTLRTLGFTKSYEAARKYSQESLVDLLFNFKQNMTPELKIKLTSKGAKVDLIDDLLTKANQLHAANLSQEFFKDERKNTSKDTVEQLNAIYDEVISVAKLASKFLEKDPSAAEKFSYSYQLQKLTGAPSAATKAKKAKAAKALENA